LIEEFEVRKAWRY